MRAARIKTCKDNCFECPHPDCIYIGLSRTEWEDKEIFKGRKNRIDRVIHEAYEPISAKVMGLDNTAWWKPY